MVSGWDWAEGKRSKGCLPFPFSSASLHPSSTPPTPTIAVAVTFTLSLFSGTAATFCHVIPNPAPALAAPKQTRASPQSPPLAAAPQPPPQPWARDAITSA